MTFKKLDDIGFDSKDLVDTAIYNYLAEDYNFRCLQRFIDFLKDQVILFCMHLNKYLVEEEKNRDQKKLNFLLQKLGFISGYSYTNSLILSFNYTRLNGNVINVHGVLDEKHDDDWNIIVGVDPSNNVEYRVLKSDKSKKRDFLKKYGEKEFFTKTYQKLILEGNGYIRHIDFPKPDVVNYISFYGHSLNEQDYSYFQSIFDFYHIYDGKVKLRFFWSKHDDVYSPSEIIDKIYDLINEYGETLDNKEHGHNLLHKLILEGRLIIQEINFLYEVNSDGDLIFTNIN